MGGYGSGRKRAQPLTAHCIQLDMSNFKSHMQRPGRYEGHIEVVSGDMLKYVRKDEKPGLYFSIDIYDEASKKDARGARWPVYGRLALNYLARIGDGPERSIDMWLPLVTTPCHYGGVRWWMIAPCCGTRARVLYLASATPQCRACAGLHYASQMATPEEHSKTYERYLLANYGYWWAVDRYERLPHHYLEITPDVEQLRQRSMLTSRIELIRLLIDCERFLLKSHMKRFLSLRNEEDRQCYRKQLLEQMSSHEGADINAVHALAAARALERGIFERNPDIPYPADLEAREAPPEGDQTPTEIAQWQANITALEDAHKAMVDELNELKAAA